MHIDIRHVQQFTQATVDQAMRKYYYQRAKTELNTQRTIRGCTRLVLTYSSHILHGLDARPRLACSTRPPNREPSIWISRTGADEPRNEH